MARRWQSTLILVAVFGLGLAAGIGGMVWAWPGMRPHFFPPRHPETFTEHMTRTLKLTPAQVPQVQAVATETRQRNHEIYLQFVPAYTKVCNDFVAVQKQQHDAYAPIRQLELDKLHAILTPSQWQTFQQRRNPPFRLPDLCRHLMAPSGAPATAAPHPPERHRR